MANKNTPQSWPAGCQSAIITSFNTSMLTKAQGGRSGEKLLLSALPVYPFLANGILSLVI